MFGKIYRAQPKRNSGIKDRGLKQELRLGSERAFNKTVRQTLGLEAVKQAVGISIGLRKVSDRALCRGRPPPKQKKRLKKHIPRKRRNGGTPGEYRHVSPLLNNDREISKYATAVTETCKPVAEQRPRDKQIRNSCYWVTALQTNMFLWQQFNYNNEERCILCGPCLGCIPRIIFP
jgi:hypothetical protein